jgi:hypothetical protein
VKTINALLAILVLALGATQLSCSVNDYCLNCGTDDGGMGSDGDANDGGDGDAIDAPPDASCVPDGIEQCDGKDNDCNGLTDDVVGSPIGDLCDNQFGACSGGTKICQNGQIKCTKNPTPESCNNIDDNCNDDVDEGDPGGGGICGTQAGACVAGTERCIGGQIECPDFQDHTGDPELCNGQDDDCDNVVDDNPTDVGQDCGPIAQDGKGICVAGTFMCEGGVPVCKNAVFPRFETCNHVDDDCNDIIDDGFDTQNDPNNCGDCVGSGFTGVVCGAAQKTCINSQNAGDTCTSATTCTPQVGPNAPACVVNSVPKCTLGACGVQCNAGFYNLNGSNADGCEYKCSLTGPEVCDGIDNDCDGLVDANDPGMAAAPANLCKGGGECSVGQATPTTAPTPVCDSVVVKSWTCPYQGDVGDETCDDKNNDCDANIDETFPLKGTQCSDNEPGVCLDKGTLGCNLVTENTLQCNYSTNNPDLPTPGQPLPGVDEDCNARDDDCDNDIDENLLPGHGQEWVAIGNGVQMMKYEASRPDADDTSPGNDSSIVCSRANVLPWATINYVDAEAECVAIGARLCTEQEWHRTCSVVAAPTTPYAVLTAGTTIEAENYTGIAIGTQTAVAETSPGQCGADTVDDDTDGLVNDGCPINTGNSSGAESGAQCRNANDDDGDGAVNDGCPINSAQPRSWVPDYTVAPGNSGASGTFSGISAMEATPNIGGSIAAANAAAQSPRLDYTLDVAAGQTGTYHVYVRMFANNANDNTVYVSISGSPATPLAVTAGTNNSWVWVDAAGTITLTAGAKTLSVWMGDDGTKIDQIILKTSATLPTDPTRATLDASRGGTWAYLAPEDPLVYDGNVCNGDDYDTVPGGSDQDDILATESLDLCAANVGGGVFDMSGNVKEWTKAHLPGENPIRGGASNNSQQGISCALNFTLADDALKLPNIGFRCCK